jgi:hypothetical protein
MIMATAFNTQTGNGEYRLQFETNNKDHFLLMQATARQCIDGKPQTNADCIRAMSDEELADKLHQLYLIFSDEGYYDFGRLFCDGKAGCIDEDGEVHCNDDRRKACITRWLQQPVWVSGDG